MRWPRESEEAPDSHRKTTSPDQVFPVRKGVFKIFISVFVVFFIVSSAVVIHYYDQYARIIDLKLAGQVFQHTAKIYAASSILVTNLSGASRSKRRLVEFKDIPKVLVDAVTAGEDRSFFSHHWTGSLTDRRRIRFESSRDSSIARRQHLR